MLRPWAFVELGIGRTDNRLDLGTVDQTGDIWIRNLCSGQAGRYNVINIIQGY